MQNIVMKPLLITGKQLHTLLPTHLLLDENLTIVSVGSEISNLYGSLENLHFSAKFSFLNATQAFTYCNLQFQDNAELLLVFCNEPNAILKCKLCVFEESKQLLLLLNVDQALAEKQHLHTTNTNLDIIKLDIALEEIGHTFWFHDLDSAIHLKDEFSIEKTYDGFYDFYGNYGKHILSKVKSWLASIHPDDKWMVQEADNAYRKGEIHHHALEYRIVDKNGGVKWISDKGIVYEYKNGIPQKLICIHTDITELYHNKIELDKQKKFYETILNNLPADIAVFDKNHTYLFVNPSGIKSEAVRQWIIGKKDEDYIQFRNLPTSILDERRAMFNEVKRTLKPKSWEQVITKPDGSKEHILRIFNPYVNEQNEFELAIGYGINITEQKLIEQKIALSEAKYRILIDKSLAVITMHDMNGVFIMVNPIIEEVLGYPMNDIIGKHITHYMHKEDAKIVNANYLQTIFKEKTAKGVLRFIHKNGSVRYILYNNYLLENTYNEAYVISHKVDITDRIKAEQQLSIAHQQIKKEALAKERFLANMSHELRTPMNGILGIINFLEKTKLTKQQKEYVQLIKGSSNSLLTILNEVLDIEKIIAGKLKLEKIPFNISTTISKIVASAKYKTDEKQLSLDLKDRLPKNLYVLGDPHRLGQIVLNLISNAIKFTNSGGNIIVALELISSNLENVTIEISVTDTGIGIPKNKLSKIFEPFEQAEISISRKFGGTGLGLSICKQLVEMQHGTIKAESSEGKGSVFSFLISYPKTTKKIGLQQLELKNTISPSILKGAKILIAEDVEVNQYVLKHLLEKWGCKVTVAENGKEAVADVRKTQFDLIFMDIQMPEMNGFEATSSIRKLTDTKKAAIPIVAVTANLLKDITKNFIKSGINDYILKPYNEREVFAIVEKYVHKSKVNPPVKTKKIVNVIKYKRDADNNKQFMIQTAEIFIRNAPISYNLMLDALAKKDFQKIAKEIHKLKFSVDFFGMKNITELLKQLETLIDNKGKHVLLKKQFGALGVALNNGIEQLKNIYFN
jgi:PAS domain S-box-containing protein